MSTYVSRWIPLALAFTVFLGLSPTSILAQSNESSGPDKEKLQQLKTAFATGKKAAQSENHEQAYEQLGQAYQLANELEQTGALTQIRDKLLIPLSKQWGNKAIDNEQYEDALSHFKKGLQYADSDAEMQYGKGLALINMKDSTEAGLQALQKAAEVGNETGNTRVSGLATERIRDEFLAKASEALNAKNPTEAQANTALSALDQMEEYVDPSAKSLFYRGRALFEKGNYQEAMEVARRGLEMHQGSRSDAAKYHFIIGESQFRNGDKEAACQTFTQATFGDYKQRAEHYLKNDCE